MKVYNRTFHFYNLTSLSGPLGTQLMLSPQTTYLFATLCNTYLFATLLLSLPYQRKPRENVTNYKPVAMPAFTATVKEHLQTFNLVDYNNTDQGLKD